MEDKRLEVARIGRADRLVRQEPTSGLLRYRLVPVWARWVACTQSALLSESSCVSAARCSPPS